MENSPFFHLNDNATDDGTLPILKNPIFNIGTIHDKFSSDKEQTIENPKEDETESKIPGIWNYQTKLLLKKIGEKSMGFKWMHNEDRVHYEHVYSSYKRAEVILLAIILILTSSGFIYLLSITGLDQNKIIVIIISGLQLILLFGASVTKALREDGNYDKLIFDHKYSSSRFNQISLHIQTQLALDINNRMNDVFFVKYIVDTYNKLIEISPSIKDATMNKYIDTVKDTDIHRPLFLGNPDEKIDIPINTHHNEESKEIDKLYDNNKYLMDRWLQNF